MMRLQKFLAHAGVCSRRTAETCIARGQVVVNGQVVTRPGVKVDPARDAVCFDGRQVFLSRERSLLYIALNKPPGVVTSCVRQGKDPIVLNLVPVKERVYPVGRLDKDSCGLLLLTNDGALHNRLSHPSFDHEKAYRVTTAAPLSRADLDAMARGMVLDGKPTRRARVRPMGPRRFEIILKQGINRQIRRMVGQSGNRVIHLQRVRMGPVTLGRLPEGGWRHLTDEEKRALMADPGSGDTAS